MWWWGSVPWEWRRKGWHRGAGEERSQCVYASCGYGVGVGIEFCQCQYLCITCKYLRSCETATVWKGQAHLQRELSGYEDLALLGDAKGIV